MDLNLDLSSIFPSLTEEQRVLIKGTALGITSGLVVLYCRYKQLQRKMIDDTFNEPALWKNDYPIVLVHGYCGSTMDENWILGGYFHYAFSKVSRYLNVDHGKT